VFTFNLGWHKDGFLRDFSELRKEQFPHCDCLNLAESTKKTLYDDLKNFKKRI